MKNLAATWMLLATAPASTTPLPSEIEAAHDAETIGTARSTLVSFDVSAEGKVLNCITVETSGSDKLDQGACKILLERARYNMKRDAMGKPVPEFGRKMRFRWMLDDGAESSPADQSGMKSR